MTAVGRIGRTDINFKGIQERTHGDYFILNEGSFSSEPLNEPDIFVRVEVLEERYEIPRKTIDNGVSNWKKGTSKFWVAFILTGRRWIRYSSIPLKTINSHRMPVSAQALYDQLKVENFLRKKEDISYDFQNVLWQLREAFTNEFPKYVEFYQNDFTETQWRIAYSQCHSLFVRVIALKNRHCKLGSLIFQAYHQLMVEQISMGHQFIFVCRNEKSFWRKINLAVDDGIKKTIIHASKGVTRKHTVKYSKEEKAFIRQCLRNPRNFRYSAICAKFKRKFGRVLNPNYIKFIMHDLHTRNLVKFDSQGRLYSRLNSTPKLKRCLADGPGEWLQADYYFLQLLCVSAMGHVIRLVMFAIMDVFSRKIVGWSLARGPSPELALAGFRNCFTECGFLPALISIDNDPNYRNPIFKNFRSKSELLGLMWRDNEPKLPTYNAELESFFSTFETKYCSELPFFIGESVHSRNDRGTPSDEVLQKVYSQKSKLPREEEMPRIVGKLIQNYNYSTYDNVSEFLND